MSYTLRVAIYFFISAAAACGPTGVEATTCQANSDCFAHYACDVGGTNQCLRACTQATDCLGSQQCDIANGQTQGVCRFADMLAGNGNSVSG